MPLRMSSTACWIVSLRGAFEPGSVLRRRQEEQQEAQQVECFITIACFLNCCTQQARQRDPPLIQQPPYVSAAHRSCSWSISS